MNKIRCSAYDCMHNMGGSCDAGVVSVWEKVDDGAAWCGTYTHKLDDDNVTSDVSPLGFKCSRQSGSIACAMQSCRYQQNGLCDAQEVFMDVLVPDTGAYCMTYGKRA